MDPLFAKCKRESIGSIWVHVKSNKFIFGMKVSVQTFKKYFRIQMLPTVGIVHFNDHRTELQEKISRPGNFHL